MEMLSGRLGVNFLLHGCKSCLYNGTRTLSSTSPSLAKNASSNDEAKGSQKKEKPLVDLAAPVREKLKRPKKGEPAKVPDGEVKLGKRVLAAVKKVSMSMEGNPEQIESELVQKLKSHGAQKINFGDIVKGMIIDSSKEAQITRAQELSDVEDSRADRVRRLLQSAKRPQQYESGRRSDDRRQEDGRRDEQYERVDLFGAQPIGIFTGASVADQVEQPPSLSTWEVLEAKVRKLAITHPPANGFEEMILWTEKNILWKYPIDNEQGMDEEAKYSFVDHVFLESYIEHWCPDHGALRKFMDLVCVSLAKNAYLTVPEKREYLDWYENYFRDKATILKETGAGIIKQQKQSIG